MPILNIVQPEYISINDTLRLRKYDGNYHLALKWYQDKDTLMLVNGNCKEYNNDRLKQMYDYLESQGEEYFIEVKESGVFIPIGDVTFWQKDMPIVIGDKNYRGTGIGKLVVMSLLNRARELGFAMQYIDEIFDFNVASRRLFISCGFFEYRKTEKGAKYVCNL
ncbi:MAG TPA: GNAT family N-acetyltransferase [Lachnospiraceae bacterium]|nr:GNAT family N-acetyltransferase [Lachnospiraceae bacterium]